MGWTVYEEVRERSRLVLGDKARLVMLDMAACADEETRICHPGTARLMQTARCSRSTVFRLLRRICESVEVEQLQRGGGAGRAAEYRIAELAALYAEGPSLGDTQEGRTQADTQSTHGRVFPGRHPRGSQEGRRRVSPTRARVTASRVNEPPQPPASGGRQRDRERYRQEVEEWVAEQLPELHDERAITAVNQAITHGRCRSADQVRSFLATHWPQLGVREPSLEPRAAELGADDLQAAVRAITRLPERLQEAAWERLEAVT